MSYPDARSLSVSPVSAHSLDPIRQVTGLPIRRKRRVMDCPQAQRWWWGRTVIPFLADAIDRWTKQYNGGCLKDKAVQ